MVQYLCHLLLINHCKGGKNVHFVNLTSNKLAFFRAAIITYIIHWDHEGIRIRNRNIAYFAIFSEIGSEKKSLWYVLFTAAFHMLSPCGF